MLFKDIIDRKQTQLAYRVKFFPWQVLTEAAKELVTRRAHTYMRKAKFLSNCNEELTTFYYDNIHYTIVWEYNNIPTRAEWERRTDGYLVHLDMRISPAVDCHAVAIISF